MRNRKNQCSGAFPDQDISVKKSREQEYFDEFSVQRRDAGGDAAGY